MTKILIDTANISEIEKHLDIISGITTNPKLLRQENDINLDKLSQFVNSLDQKLLLFYQVNSEEDFINAKKINNSSAKVIIKIPMIPKMYHLFKRNTPYRICSTMVYDLVQLNQARLFAADYSIIIFAKNEDENFLQKAIEYRNNLAIKLKLVVGSVRTKNDVEKAIRLGADFITIPPKVLNLAYNNLQAEAEYEEAYGQNGFNHTS